MAHRRGANLPYFGKQSEYWAYSPHETKRGVLRGFPVLVTISGREKEPVFGRIFPDYSIPSKHSFQKTYRILEESSPIENYDIVHTDNYENRCDPSPLPELCRTDSLNNSTALPHALHEKIRDDNHRKTGSEGKHRRMITETPPPIACGISMAKKSTAENGQKLSAKMTPSRNAPRYPSRT